MGRPIIPPKGYRTLSPHDFEDDIIINATYIGKSDCLDTGKTYTVQYIRKRNRLSVPVSLNPDIEPNYGREFTLGSFAVEDESVRFRDALDGILADLNALGNTEAINVINKHLKTA